MSKDGTDAEGSNMSDQTDHGKKPYVLDIEATTVDNDNFRTTLWTGEHLQLTVMAIRSAATSGLRCTPRTTSSCASNRAGGWSRWVPRRTT